MSRMLLWMAIAHDTKEQPVLWVINPSLGLSKEGLHATQVAYMQPDPYRWFGVALDRLSVEEVPSGVGEVSAYLTHDWWS